MSVNLKLSKNNRQVTFGDFLEPAEPAGQQSSFFNPVESVASRWEPVLTAKSNFDRDWIYTSPIICFESPLSPRQCIRLYSDLVFLASGLIRSRVHGIKKDFPAMKGGQSDLFYFPHQDGSGEIAKRKHTLGVNSLY